MVGSFRAGLAVPSRVRIAGLRVVGLEARRRMPCGRFASGHGGDRVRLEMYARVVPAADAPDGAGRYLEVVTATPDTGAPGTGARGIGQRLRRTNPWVLDGVVAALFLVVGLLSTQGRGDVPRADYQPTDAFSVLLVVLTSVPYAARRRAPLAVFVVSSIAVSLLVGLGYNQGVTPLFLLLGAVTVGTTCSPRQTAIAAGFIAVALVLLLVLDAPNFGAENFAGQAALFAAMFLVGINLRTRRARVVALEERALAVEREKEEEARRALADERLHIARELHDVVAHSMGVIAVQASVGEHVIDTTPEEAKRALQAISEVSRSTLAEIRHMLGVLRESSDGDAGLGASPAYSPAPGLDELDRLVRELEGAGVPVDVTYQGTRVELPRGVDLTAYRIVQEALTNVLKHAGHARATVSVCYEPGVLALEIADDGRGVDGRAQASGRSGHGLVGMRERVAVYGGTLDAGPRRGGGFRVAVRLPYGEPS
jgi:signal transduction histidine kinase